MEFICLAEGAVGFVVDSAEGFGGIIEALGQVRQRVRSPTEKPW